jgi:uncharacterized protein (DUF2062 family)
MPKKLLKKIAPSANTIKQQKCLGFLGKALHSPLLWHLNRHSVALAFSIGFFMMWVPLPSQMVLAALAAILVRANLPISISLVWITNPITIPPMFYFAYLLGAKVIGQEPMKMEFQLNWEWFSTHLSHSWEPFLLGCLILAVISSLVGYIGIKLVWRLHILKKLQERRRKHHPS